MSMCLYNPEPPCRFKKKGECLKYVDEPIPVGHLGGEVLGVTGDKFNPLSTDFRLVPRFEGDGCCEYIKERGENIPKRTHNRFAWIHDLSTMESLIGEVNAIT